MFPVFRSSLISLKRAGDAAFARLFVGEEHRHPGGPLDFLIESFPAVGRAPSLAMRLGPGAAGQAFRHVGFATGGEFGRRGLLLFPDRFEPASGFQQIRRSENCAAVAADLLAKLDLGHQGQGLLRQVKRAALPRGRQHIARGERRTLPAWSALRRKRRPWSPRSWRLASNARPGTAAARGCVKTHSSF
jgi:hypothetical protein